MIGAFRLTTLGANRGITAPAFILRYSGAGTEGSVVSSCIDDSGNYYMAVNTTSATMIGTQDIIAVKLAANGSVVWTTRIGRSTFSHLVRGMVVVNGTLHIMLVQGSAVMLAAIDPSTGSILASEQITTVSAQVVTAPSGLNSGLHPLKYDSSRVGYTVQAGATAATSFAFHGTASYAVGSYANFSDGHGSNQTSYVETPWGSTTNAAGDFAKAYTMSGFMAISYTSGGSTVTRYLNTIGSVADMCGSNNDSVLSSGCNFTFMSTSTNPIVTKINTSAWAYKAKSITSAVGAMTAQKVYTNQENNATYAAILSNGTAKWWYLVKMDVDLNIVWQLKIANTTTTTTTPSITSVVADANSVYVLLNFNLGTGGGSQGIDTMVFKLPTDGSKTGTYISGSNSWVISTTTDLVASTFTLTTVVNAATDTAGLLPASSTSTGLTTTTNGLTNTVTTV